VSLPVTTMKAAILVEQHRELTIDDVELPAALERGQVLVKVACSGICGSQLGEIDGVKGPDRHLPHLLGHEGGGTVVAVGEGVTYVRVGDRVVLHWREGAGLGCEPPSYRWRGKPLGAGWVTTFNEYAVVAENRVTAVPADFELDLAALFGCPVTTGLGVVRNDAALAAGESIVVLGAGGVGLSVVQGAVLAGASSIVVVDLYADKLRLAAELGATHVIDGADGEVEDALRAIVGADGADVVVENTGNVDLIELAYRLSKPRGRTVLVGVPSGDRPARIHTLPLHFGKLLTGSHGGDARPDVDIPRGIELYRAGALKLAELITDRYPLVDINRAIADLRAGKVAGRCLLEIAD